MMVLIIIDLFKKLCTYLKLLDSLRKATYR